MVAFLLLFFFFFSFFKSPWCLVFIFTVFTLTSGHSNLNCGPSVRRINGGLIIDQKEEKILPLASLQIPDWGLKIGRHPRPTHPSAFRRPKCAESKTSDGPNWRQHVRWALIDNSVSARMKKKPIKPSLHFSVNKTSLSSWPHVFLFRPASWIFSLKNAPPRLWEQIHLFLTKL